MIIDTSTRNRQIWDAYEQDIEEHGAPLWSRIAESLPGVDLSERQMRRIVGEIRRGKRALSDEPEPEPEPEPDPEEAPPRGIQINISQQRYGNYLRWVAEGSWEAGYPSVDAFLESMGVDADMWEIRRGKPNSWPTSGWDKANERPWTVINHQVNAELLLRSPEPLEPQVQPITLHPRPREGSSIQKSPLKTALFISDPHFGFYRDLDTNELTPFHDRRALDIAVQAAIDMQPEEIIIGGDTLDLPDWSTKFVRSPNFYFSTQPAIVEAAWWLGQLREASPTARIMVLEGNHDARLETALATHLNQVYQLKPADEMHLPPAMSVPRLLALHAMDIEYEGGYPDVYVWLNDAVAITHGDKARNVPGATVGAYVRENDVTVLHGHIHRDERASRSIRTRSGSRIIRAICPGCTCHIDGRVPGSKRGTWQQGIALVRYDEDTRYTVTTVTIDDGEAIIEGQIYRGEERLKELYEQTEWSFG